MNPIDPYSLRPHYSAFLEASGHDDRILLTGHSHQAWPDAAREGVLAAFAHAARHVDDKWAHATEAANAVRAQVVQWVGGRPEDIALGQSSHELVSRFLSALRWERRRHVLTTDGEFHSLGRQLRRLSELHGVEVEAIPVTPLNTLAERLARAVRDDTAALMVSTVLFETASVVPHLKRACEAAHAHGAEVLLDAYHHLNVVPWRQVDPQAFVAGGGYKYAQWGEGCCFLRVPPGCELRPVYTGWFAEFGQLQESSAGGKRVGFGVDGSLRFAGSTYDPTSHYRARAVIEFAASKKLSVSRLRALSLRQTERLIDGLTALGETLLTPRSADARGGFVTIEVERAADVAAAMRHRGVYVDARRDRLRFGPAPYVTDEELDRAIALYSEVSRSAR